MKLNHISTKAKLMFLVRVYAGLAFAWLMPRTFMKRAFKNCTAIDFFECGTRVDKSIPFDGAIAIGPAGNGLCRYKLTAVEYNDGGLVDIDVAEFEAPAWLVKAHPTRVEAYLRKHGIGFATPALAVAV